MPKSLLLFLLLTHVAFSQSDEGKKASPAVKQEPVQTGHVANVAAQTITVPQPFLMKSEGGTNSAILEWAKALLPVLAALVGVYLTQRHGQKVLERQLLEAARLKKWELNRDVYRQLLADMRTLISTYDELEHFTTDDFPPGDNGELDWSWRFSNRVWKAARERLVPEQSSLMRTIYASMLSLNTEGRLALEGFLLEFPTKRSWNEESELCKSTLDRLLAAGKKELGM
jgi:hypothetical protein